MWQLGACPSGVLDRLEDTLYVPGVATRVDSTTAIRSSGATTPEDVVIDLYLPIEE